jgi:hypothetical protein
MKTFKKTLLLLMLLAVFTACIDDNESLYNYRIDIATVINPNKTTSFQFQLDDNRLMRPVSSNLVNYIPKDGQRIVANYTLLSDIPSSITFDYQVKLNDVYNVLTKEIFAITPAKQDSIGNDSITVSDIWVGGGFLNIEFVYAGYNKTHLINLVSDASKVYTDGKTHLEFRHNANNDRPVEFQTGIASFNLKSLLPISNAAGNSLIGPINLVIHVNVPNQVAEKTYELTYNWGYELTYNWGSATLAPKLQLGFIQNKVE